MKIRTLEWTINIDGIKHGAEIDIDVSVQDEVDAKIVMDDILDTLKTQIKLSVVEIFIKKQLKTQKKGGSHEI